jgi:hypothetical protein
LGTPEHTYHIDEEAMAIIAEGRSRLDDYRHRLAELRGYL